MGERRAKFGPYVYTAEMGTLRVAADCVFARWASVHEVTGTSHLVYQLQGPARDKFTIRKFLRAAEGAGGVSVPHGLGISSYALQASGTACLVTAYPGDLGGVTTLAQLVRAKGGRLGSHEVARAAEHLMEAFAHGEASGRWHGAFDMDGCVVDRGGRVAVELFGFAAHWMGSAKEGERLGAAQRRSLAIAAREMLGAAPAAWEAWALELESGVASSWERIRATMPRMNDTLPTTSAPGSIVRTIWDKVKQIAARG